MQSLVLAAMQGYRGKVGLVGVWVMSGGGMEGFDWGLGAVSRGSAKYQQKNLGVCLDWGGWVD